MNIPHICVPLGATPNLTRFSPTVQAIILKSYQGSLQQVADLGQPLPLPRSPFEKEK